MGYLNPDLTGADPTCKADDDPYVIYRTGQRIELPVAVYLDSIVVTQQGATNVPLHKGIDWDVDQSIDVDYTTMSRMKLSSSAFRKVLVRSIYFKKAATEDTQYIVSLAYQRLYPLAYKEAVITGTDYEMTPELMTDVLHKLEQLIIMSSPVEDGHTSISIVPKLLPEDRDRSDVGNIIANEPHVVNVFGGQNIIRPVQGSFFRGSVTIKTISGTPLERGKDFVVFGLNHEKTRISPEPSGVYEYIMITKAIADTLHVTYHAYGGEVSQSDLSAVYKIVNNINRYLDQSAFVTSNTLGDVPVFRSLTQRLNLLEEELRKNLTQGFPAYIDSTNATVRRMKIRSVDADHHWWTIAELYKVQGSDEVVIADQARFRIQMLNSKIMADVIVALDLTHKVPFTIDAVGVVQDLGYVPFASYGTAPVVMPQFRVIHNTSIDNTSGALLQIGLTLPGLDEILTIEDHSGMESCWKFYDDTATAVMPKDNMIQLPNQDHVWSTMNTSSREYRHMMPNKTGYLAWGGAQDIQSMDLTRNVLEHLLGDDFVVPDIRHIELQFTKGTAAFSVIVPMVSASTTGYPLEGFAHYPSDDAAVQTAIKVRIAKNTDGQLVLSVTPSRHPAGDSSALRHVIAHLR